MVEWLISREHVFTFELMVGEIIYGLEMWSESERGLGGGLLCVSFARRSLLLFYLLGHYLWEGRFF